MGSSSPGASQEMRAMSPQQHRGASILARLAAVARGVTSCVGNVKVLVELRIRPKARSKML